MLCGLFYIYSFCIKIYKEKKYIYIYILIYILGFKIGLQEDHISDLTHRSKARQNQNVFEESMRL